MFLRAVDLIVHNVLYKVFVNKSFDEYLCCVISFKKLLCVLVQEIIKPWCLFE
jgi:hypothetical protein